MNPANEGYDSETGGGIFDREIEIIQLDSDTDTDDDDADALRADIAGTRDRMSDTLGEIGERLNPHRVTEQVKDTIREATIGRVENMAQQATDRVSETSRGIVDTIRDNPIPAAMIGLGLGWMMWNGRSGSSDVSSRRGSADQNMSNSGNQRSSAGYGRRGYAASGYVDAYGGSEMDNYDSGVVDSIREKAGDLSDTVRGAAGDLSDRAQSMAGTVGQSTRTGARRVEDAFYENPLLTGAVTLALGLAAGLAVPATHPEVALMGDARDQMGDRVRGVVEDTKHKAEHVAEHVVDEAKSAARSEGLVPG
jgi:ElaB/YqjD/DUF883 family membrane-anchored ribosome-binding protein